MSISISTVVRPQGVTISTATSKPGTTAWTIWKTIQGKPRVAVRGAYKLTGHTGALSIVDYEVPYGVPIVYETDCGGEWASAAAVTVAGDGPWLRDVLYPAKSMSIILSLHHQSDRETRTALLRASGRRNPIAVTDVREGQMGSSMYVTKTIQERDAFLSLMDTGDVMCLTGPFTWELGPLYFVPMKVTEARQGEIYRPERYWVCEWTEVDPPQTLIYGTVANWSTVDNDTWLNTRDDSWVDTMYPVPGLRSVALRQVRWDG